MELFWTKIDLYGWKILDDEPEDVSANIIRVSFGDSIPVHRLVEYETIEVGLIDLTLNTLMERARSELRSYVVKSNDRVYGYIEMKTYDDTRYHLKATFYESDERAASRLS